ncbi:MAG: hypothetical protein ABSB49_13725, partial [Polyangia bacterium]
MVKHRLLVWSAVARQERLFGLLAVWAALVAGACGSNNSGHASADGGVHVSDGPKDRPPDAKVCSGDAGPPTKGQGEACACSSDCRTGYCVDGVCCDSACDETCKSCNLSSAPGECSFVPAGVPPTNQSACSIAVLS